MSTLIFIVVPYAAAAAFIGGVAWRVWRWAATPVPFRIPTTTGQQASLSWIAPSRVDSPASRWGVAARMAIEVLLFRSLFRNTALAETRLDRISKSPNPQISKSSIFQISRFVYLERKSLWLAAIALHWSLLIILVRHLRLFVEPVPRLASALAATDGFFQVGVPGWYLSDVAVAAALVFLLARRLRDPLIRYLTLPADSIALAALLALAGSGIVLRYAVRPDLVAVKQFTLGLAAGTAVPPGVPGWWLAAHVLSASALLAMFPFSKLMHAAGVWLSPTRNQANDSRRRRHVNPWNAPAGVHTYAEWEDEFRDKLRAAGLPLEKTE
jgi:nitrate reductase gamma subunit